MEQEQIKLTDVMKHIEKIEKSVGLTEQEMNCFDSCYKREFYTALTGKKLMTTDTWKQMYECIVVKIKKHGKIIDEKSYNMMNRMINKCEIIFKMRGCPKPTSRDMFRKFKTNNSLFR